MTRARIWTIAAIVLVAGTIAYLAQAWAYTHVCSGSQQAIDGSTGHVTTVPCHISGWDQVATAYAIAALTIWWAAGILIAMNEASKSKPAKTP